MPSPCRSPEWYSLANLTSRKLSLARWKSGPKSKKHRFSPDKPLVDFEDRRCLSCESCVDYENWLQHVVNEESAKAVAVRHKRGSRFRNKDAVFAIGGVAQKSRSRSSLRLSEIVIETGSLASMSAEKAFSILAPPIGFKASWQDKIMSSAAKLYFVLTSSRRILDRRINSGGDSRLGERTWYLTDKEFEKVMLSSGMDWMERPQLFETHRKLDLNQSGSLHISELCAVFQSAEEICRDVLHGLVDLEDLRKDLLAFRGEMSGPCLLSQI